MFGTSLASLRSSVVAFSASAVIGVVVAGCGAEAPAVDGAAEAEATAASCAGAKLDASRRCRLPNGRFARASCCAAAPGCDPAFLAAIDACVADRLQDGDLGAQDEMPWDLHAQCADAEPMAPVRDRLCASTASGGAPAFCALSPEAFATEVLPVCAQAATGAWLDRTCVFGSSYRDLFGSAEAIVVLGQSTLTAASPRTPLRDAQILSAVRATVHEPATVAEAFQAVDQNAIHVTELWDASGRRAFTAYELGAGDNSFGKIFVHGTADVVATIDDGDLAGCATSWGPERRRCTSDAACTGGARCVGRSDASPLGRCVDVARDAHPASGTACTPAGADTGCPGGSGLACFGATRGGAGLCQPAWMRGRFATTASAPIPDGRTAGVEVSLLAYGLATVDTDVRLDLEVAHPRPADLRITLVNPGGTEVLVFDGATNGATEVWLRGHAVAGFSGDEGVNGVWRLRVVDRVRGQAGTVERFGLELGSRWD